MSQSNQVRFDPGNLDEVWIYANDELTGTGKPVITADNAVIKRQRTGDSNMFPSSGYQELMARLDYLRENGG